jgi:lipase ATG15
VSVITTFVVIFLLLFLSAYHSGSNEGTDMDAPNLLHDFRYVRQDGFAYPTCAMSAEFQIPGSPTTALADYAYMASIAYVSPKSTPAWLDDWFGEDVAFDNVDLVTEFRKDDHSAVHYKLITFPSKPDFAVVTIRGTSNAWDMLSDMQIWSAAFLAQVVRSIVPVGEVWNPILKSLVQMIAILQAESLRKVSFYVQTSAFVEWLESKEMFETLRITGHSLGGGYVCNKLQ